MYKFKINKKTFIFILWLVFLLSHLIIANNTRKDGKRYVLWSDAYGYYAYLPSLIIHQDVEKFTMGYQHPETGKTINKYTSGVATLQLPFFLLGYAYENIKSSSPDAFSEDMEFFITVGTITYTFFGLVFLFFVLQRYIKKKPTTISLILLYFGTNLYYYTIGESGMSHAYSFFVISWFLWSLHHFIEKPNLSNSIQIGFAIGLATIIRPTNVMIILILLSINITSFKDIQTRIFSYLKSKYSYIALFSGIIAILPQLIYWKIQSGSFLCYSYPGEKFDNILNPQITEVLFGNVGGFFVYSAILIAFVPGLFIMFKRNYKFLAISIIILFSLITYINSSWWTPTFDCSYGPRAYIEHYPLLIIPFSFFIDSISKYWQAISLSIIAALLIFINIRFTYLYKKNPCWRTDNLGYEWNWENYFYAVRVAFFINPRPTYHFLIIDKPQKKQNDDMKKTDSSLTNP